MVLASTPRLTLTLMMKMKKRRMVWGRSMMMMLMTLRLMWRLSTWVLRICASDKPRLMVRSVLGRLDRALVEIGDILRIYKLEWIVSISTPLIQKKKKFTYLYNETMPARHRRRKGDWVLWLESNSSSVGMRNQQ